jgi:hypothetical protein
MLDLDFGAIRVSRSVLYNDFVEDEGDEDPPLTVAFAPLAEL